MEVRKLRSFLVVAKELHFGRAAEKLNITQPALTHQINQLESELGYELFDKAKRTNNRKVELTESGAYLMKEVSRVIDLLDNTLKRAKTNSVKAKQLKFGIPKISMTSEVIEVLQNLQIKFPETSFKIIEFATVISVQEALFKDDIDIGMTALPIVYKGISYKKIREETLNIIMTEKHPLAKYQKIKIEQLRNDRWIELNNEVRPNILDDIEVLCRNAGFSKDANVTQEVSNVELLLGLVKAEIGIAVFPSYKKAIPDGVISKELDLPNNKKLEVVKVLAFKETLDSKYKKLL
jgi:LysR family cyn operon transcriptional activator